MIITKLTLKNFKRFRTETVLDLEVFNKDQNIILIEALNGVWKTSILQAIQWVFFWLDNSEFHRYLNYDARSDWDYSILISLEYNDNDFNPCKITRLYRWINSESIPNQKLEFFIAWVNQDISPELWDDYLNKNFPKEISNFFFFDWEKLQYLIDPKDPKKVKGAIEKILGIETIRNLRDTIIDLKSVALREIQSLNVDKKIQIKELQLSEQEKKKEDIKTQINDLRNQNSLLVDRRNKADIELSLLAKNGLTKERLNERDSLLWILNSKNSEIKALDESLTVFREKFLDRFLLTWFSWSLLTQVSKEEEIKGRNQLSSIPENILEDIISGLYEPKCIIWGEILSENDKEKILHVLKSIISGKSQTDFSIILDLNTKSVNLLSNFLQSIGESNKVKVSDIIEQKVNLVNVRDAVQRKIEDIDREMDLSSGSLSIDSLYQESLTLSQEITKIELQLTGYEDSLNRVNLEIQRLQREIEESMIQNSGLEEKRKYIDVLNRLNSVFDSYITSLAINTKKKLEEKTFDMFSLLINSNVYSRVEITDNFEVRLIDRSWNYQDALNSGHIQILMTSMLWGLEQLSDFKLPIIIDTPLARLDPIHRKNMLEKYFSKAWWQVIILSQPSEITNEDKNNSLFSDHLKDWKFIQMNFNPDLLQTEVDYININ
jgi:DNA sulfur modification protein DndD